MKLLRNLIALLVPIAIAIWPIPSKYGHGEDVLWIQPDVKVTYREGSGVWQEIHVSLDSAKLTDRLYKSPQHPLTNIKGDFSKRITSADVVREAVKNVHDTIFARNIVPWKFHPRMSNFEPRTGKGTYKRFLNSIALEQTCEGSLDPTRSKDGLLNESYDLSITSDGKAIISAATSIGLVHGLNTFSQLFYAHSLGGAYTPLSPVSITDSPRFGHRGLNIDVSRNFYPVPAILRTIDALSYNKFNRLHIHITDAQSWPLEVPSLPELTAKGAYNPSQIYHPDDIAEIQRFGAIRGVQVYLEIDMPGHTSSIAYGYPDLIAAFNIQPNWSSVSVEPPSGTLKLHSQPVYDFVDKLLNDVLPRVGNYTPYFHTGGDEIAYAAYELDPTVKSSDPAILQPLLQKFIDTAHDHIRAAGLTPIVWEEILLAYNLTLEKDVVVQSWLSSDVVDIVERGHLAIAGTNEFWYLDCGHGDFVDFEPGAVSQASWPFLDYCAPFKNWRLMYTYDPLAGITDEEQQKLVLGGEAHVWSEQIDATSLDAVIWPRLGAAAEVLWSGAKDPVTGQNRSQLTAAPRLSEMRERLVARGVQAAVIQMPFCTQDGDQCIEVNEVASPSEKRRKRGLGRGAAGRLHFH